MAPVLRFIQLSEVSIVYKTEKLSFLDVLILGKRLMQVTRGSHPHFQELWDSVEENAERPQAGTINVEYTTWHSESLFSHLKWKHKGNHPVHFCDHTQQGRTHSAFWIICLEMLSRSPTGLAVLWLQNCDQRSDPENRANLNDGCGKRLLERWHFTFIGCGFFLFFTFFPTSCSGD